jgi:hypothetical protein
MPTMNQGHKEEDLISQICFAGPNDGLVLGASKGTPFMNDSSMKASMLITLKAEISSSGIVDLVLSAITSPHLQGANSHA